MAKESNEEIFDWVIGFEDECMQKVREEVIRTAEYNFGEKGKKIAEKYYKNIDGDEDFNLDEDSDTDPCPECVEKAKKLVEIMDFSKYVVENMCDEKLTQLLKEIDNDPIEAISLASKDFTLDTCIKIDDELMKKLVFRVFTEYLKKLWKESNVSQTR